MKRTFLLVAMLIAFKFSYAQWTGTNPVTTNSNVGIGNTNPNDKLVVTGAIRTNVGGTPGYGSFGGGFVAYDQDNGGNHLFSLTRQSNNLGISSFDGIGFAVNANAPSNNFQMFINNSGRVGIGTASPTSLLDVLGVISMGAYGGISSLRSPNNNYTNLLIGGAIKDNNNGTYTVYGDGGSNYFSAIRMDNSGGNAGAINFYNGGTTGGNNYNIANNDLNQYLRMSIVGGNVGIGVPSPQNKLDVAGTIHAKKVLIDLNGWPDYVFRPTYTLRPLSEVKTYIDQNQHLPEVPSAAAVEKSGIDVGEMNKILLKKLEEVTLYLIQKDEQLKELKSEMEELKKSQKPKQ